MDFTHNENINQDKCDYSELIRLRDEEQSVEAVQKMAEMNYNLVRYIVNKKFAGKCRYETDDLISMGSIGLMRACYLYNGTSSFSTYASKAIISSILMNMRNDRSNSVEYNKIKMHDITMDDGETHSILDVISSNRNIASMSWIPYIMNQYNISERDRRIFYDYYLRGYNQQKIANAIGITQRTVSSVLIRIETIFREYF